MNREKENREQVLNHQHTERDPAHQCVQFVFVVENLDDDDRAAQGCREREVERVQLALAQSESEKLEQEEPEQSAAYKLHHGGHENRLARGQHLFEIDFETDHEQEEN